MAIDDEQIAWEDYHGFVRSTRQPFKCACGQIFYTAEIYYEHIKTCPEHQKRVKEQLKK